MNPYEQDIYYFLKNNQYFKDIKDLEVFAKKLYTTYPNRNVVDEFKKMDLWLFADPRRKKKNYAKFICNWLSKSFSAQKIIYTKTNDIVARDIIK